MQDQPQIEALAHALIAARDAGRPFYAFTGAGVSTDSGLPDFRGKSGMWNDKTAMEAASVRGFEARPEIVWEMFVDPFLGVTLKPNDGHKAMAELVERGLLSRIVTQNVDDLHEQAGVDADLVDHLHGDLQRAECHDCLRAWPLDEMAAQRARIGGVPACEECSGPLQPSITLFGQDLPLRAWKRAREVAKKSNGVLVAGTTLGVFPAADLPTTTRRRGGRVAIINRGSTEMDSSLNAELDHRIHAGASEALRALADACAALDSESTPA